MERKYSKKASAKVGNALHEMKEGTLRSGNSGKKVTNPKQAIAIGLSEAREEGAKVPAKKTTAKKSTAPKKATAKKTTTKKSAAPKKAAVKKSTPSSSASSKGTKSKTGKKHS